MSGHDRTSVESLLKLAGERDQPTPEGLERARIAARLSWQRALAQDPRRARAGLPRPLLFAGLAASLAVIALTLFWLRDASVPAVTVARVSALQGEVRVSGADVSLKVDGLLKDGEWLDTGAGRVALAVGDALSLRADHHSRLRFEAPGHVTLLQGALYVDSGGVNAHTALRIDTPAGAVRHVGTQFQVRVVSGHTRVQVREGRVLLTPAGQSPVDLGAGDAAEVEGTRLRIEQGLPAHGSAWQWVTEAAPGFAIENRPLSEFLAWLAREHGWQLRFTDAALQSKAQEIRLHGSMSGLDAAGMLERAALVTGVPVSLREGVLSVGVQP